MTELLDFGNICRRSYFFEEPVYFTVSDDGGFRSFIIFFYTGSKIEWQIKLYSDCFTLSGHGSVLIVFHYVFQYLWKAKIKQQDTSYIP